MSANLADGVKTRTRSALGGRPRSAAGLRTLVLLVMTSLMVLLVAAPAWALSARGPVKADAPGKGFPLWYQDDSGTALELNIGPVNSFFDPIDPANPASVDAGFGEEAFYWDANAIIGLASGGSADLIMALEAAWLNGAPVVGDEIVFQRLRIRVDTPVAGTYTIIHPYGVRVFDAPAGLRGINFTEDVGLVQNDFDLALNGFITDFLVSSAAPAGFLGDAATEATVTGSPFGTNYFEVQGPAGSNLGGPGVDTVRTDLFVVQGKIFEGTPFFVDRATYHRDDFEGAVDVWVTSTEATTLDLSWPGVDPVDMATDGAGKFFVSVPLPDPANLPETVTVTANRGLAGEYSLATTLEDIVQIDVSEFDGDTGTLTVEAVSSDQFAGGPALEATGLGALTGGVLSVPALTVPPLAVEVTSAAGGYAMQAVAIVTGSARPTAVDDTALTAVGEPVDIDVLANDLPVDPATLDPTTVAVTTAPANGTTDVDPVTGIVTYTPGPGYMGPDSFEYTVGDSAGLPSNAALVSISVVAPEPTVTQPATGDPVTQGDTVPVEWTIPAGVSSGHFHTYAYDGTYHWLNSQAAVAAETTYAFNWLVDEPVGTGYVVRVWYQDGSGNWLYFGDSAPAFDIVSGVLPEPTVTLPNTGDPVTQGAVVPVEWTIPAAVASGHFHTYAYDGTYYWLNSQAADGAATTYGFDWTVAEPAGPGYVIRVWYVDASGNWLYFGDSAPAFEVQAAP